MSASWAARWAPSARAWAAAATCCTRPPIRLASSEARGRLGLLLAPVGDLIDAGRHLLDRPAHLIGRGGQLIGGGRHLVGQIPDLDDERLQGVDEGVEPGGQLAQLVLGGNPPDAG